MVEQVYSLDAVFGSLSNPARRDMLKRLSQGSMSVGQIAEHYKLSFAGVAKHIGVLERSGLINKSRQGKEQVVSIDPSALAAANDYIDSYKELWERRLDSLDNYLRSSSKEN